MTTQPPPTDNPSPQAVLVWAVWGGLIAGGLELVAMLVKCHWLDPRNYNVSRHYVWMYPAAGALVLLIPGTALALAAALRRRAVSTAWVVRLLAFFAFLGLLFRAPVYTAACLLLAAGAAYRAGTYVAARRPGFDRLVGRTVGPLVGCLLLTVALSYAREFRPASVRPPAAAAAKNVLLLVLDTVRAESLSLYGYERETSPQLKRIAERGVRFDRALSTAPWTAPSHASLFTGRWPHELTIGWDRPLDRRFPTLAEFLAGRGYDTAGFVANTTYCSYETGLDRGFAHYEDYEVSPRTVLLCSSVVQRGLNFVRNRAAFGAFDDVKRSASHRKSAERINRDFLAWLKRERGRERPFFAFLNYYDAHHPYLAPATVGAPFGKAPATHADFVLLRTWWECDKRRLSSRQIELVRDSYDRCIAYLDDQIGRLIDELDGLGLLENTLVIVTSDHGEHLGEQRLFGHGCSLYRPELHVPLVMIAPGSTPKGKAVRDPVSLRDLPATVADLLGFRKGSPFPGRSLALAWSDAPGPAEVVLSEIDGPPEADPNGGRSPVRRGPMTSLVAAGRHYVRNGDGREELYDFDNDPREERDLAADPGEGETLRWFRGKRPPD